jgi:hypothetical protein
MNLLLMCDNKPYTYDEAGGHLSLEMVKDIERQKPLKVHAPWRGRFETDRVNPDIFFKWLYIPQWDVASCEVFFTDVRKNEHTELPQAGVFVLPGNIAHEKGVLRAAGFRGPAFDEFKPPGIVVVSESDLLLRGRTLWGYKDGQNRVGDSVEVLTTLVGVLLGCVAQFCAYGMYRVWGEEPFRRAAQCLKS